MWYRRDGFTLVEVLVAVALMAIVLVSLLGLQASAIRMRAHSRLSSAALNEASDFLDQVAASDPKALSVDNEFIADSGFDGAAVTLPSGAVLARRWDIRRDFPLVGLLTVRVLICWQEPRQPEPVGSNCDFTNQAAPHVYVETVAGR